MEQNKLITLVFWAFDSLRIVVETLLMVSEFANHVLFVK